MQIHAISAKDAVNIPKSHLIVNLYKLGESKALCESLLFSAKNFDDVSKSMLKDNNQESKYNQHPSAHVK